MRNRPGSRRDRVNTHPQHGGGSTRPARVGCRHRRGLAACEGGACTHTRPRSHTCACFALVYGFFAPAPARRQNTQHQATQLFFHTPTLPPFLFLAQQLPSSSPPSLPPPPLPRTLPFCRNSTGAAPQPHKTHANAPSHTNHICPVRVGGLLACQNGACAATRRCVTRPHKRGVRSTRERRFSRCRRRRRLIEWRSSSDIALCVCVSTCLRLHARAHVSVCVHAHVCARDMCVCVRCLWCGASGAVRGWRGRRERRAHTRCA
jgi:hypothetical protein